MGRAAKGWKKKNRSRSSCRAHVHIASHDGRCRYISSRGIAPRRSQEHIGSMMKAPQKRRRPLDDRIQYFAERDSLQDLQALFELEQANAALIRALEAAEARLERERTK